MARSDAMAPRVVLILLLTLVASGCTAIAGIFKAGFWTGIIVVALIVIALVVVTAKARG